MDIACIAAPGHCDCKFRGRPRHLLMMVSGCTRSMMVAGASGCHCPAATGHRRSRRNQIPDGSRRGLREHFLLAALLQLTVVCSAASGAPTSCTAVQQCEASKIAGRFVGEVGAVRPFAVPMKHDDGTDVTTVAHVRPPPSAGVWAWMCDRTNGLAECLQQVEDKPPSSLRGAIQIIMWRDLEPADGVFNWSTFDANLAKAADNGLQLQPVVYIYDCASPLPDFMANVSKQIPVYRDGPEDGRLCHAPDYLDPAFQDRWHRVIIALATHLAELPEQVREKVWASQIVAGITGDNRPWKGVVQNHADAINASAWMAYTRSIADMYIEAFVKVDIPVVANLEDGFSGQQDQGWFLSRAYSKGMRGASVKEGVPSHFYNLNNESSTFNRDSPLLLEPQPDGSFARARGEMDGGVAPNPVQDTAGSYGNWAQSPWWNLQANAEWALTFGLDVWNVNSGFIGNNSFAPTLDFFNRHAGHRNPATAPAAFISFRDSLDTADVNRWPVAQYGPVASKSHPDSLANKDRMIKIQQQNKERGARLPPDKADYFASLHSVKQRKAPALFDVCWLCFSGNYGRFIEQVNPATTSIGYWQLGPVDQGYGRFARGLEHSSGKNEITVQLDPRFGTAGTKAFIRVVYFDQGSGRWMLGYDNAQVATVQKHNSKKWESVEANVTLGNSRDITLMSMDAEDDVFSLLEVLLLT